MERSCSEGSLEVGEPLAGTAVEAELWIVIEHGGPWGPKGADDSGLPAEVVAHLTRFTAQEKRARVQLIRRPERSKSGSSVYLARSTPGQAALLASTLADLAQLLALDLAAWAEGAVPPGFRALDAPLYLVCVHGRRDRCCALRGMPVYSALSALHPDAVFQTTHLGGHRFAATLLVLPEGICYGRVEAREMEGLAAAHAARRLSTLARVRGRTAYPAAVQAAELRLREELSEHALSALLWLGARDDGAGALAVRFRHLPSGDEHTVRVERRPLAPFPQSCGATPRPSEALFALTSR